jgi:dimethylhistidine N-methyltransferase
MKIGLRTAEQHELIEVVRAGLCQEQKRLPYALFYDEIGSALFEVITLLPEYGVTRAESRLLRRYAGAIVDHLDGPVAVAELGSGTGKKTRWILEALTSRYPVRYFPIDISSSALDQCERDLEAIPGISVHKLNEPHLEGLEHVVSLLDADAKLAVLFLGSSVGNLEPPEAESLLANTRRLLKEGDALLLGTDLEKNIARMLLAYDDRLGVTAAFNMNLLAHLNRALGADFDLTAFAHEARYDEQEHRIEMHLRSLKQQSVALPVADLRISLHENETIWTESSYKYRPQQLLQMAKKLGFEPIEQWIDEEWPFALNLWVVP